MNSGDDGADDLAGGGPDPAGLEALSVAEHEANRAFHDRLGRADWLWDPDMEMHLPCCSVRIDSGLTATTKRGIEYPITHACGNGPLTGDQIISGDCGEHSGA